MSPYAIEWLDDTETCIVLRPVGNWNWSDFQAGFAETAAWMNTKNYPVDYIAVLEQGIRIPGPGLLTHARSNYHTHSDNLRLAIVVSAPAFVRAILDVLATMMGDPGHFKFVGTFEEAVAIVEQRRAADAD